MLLTCSKRFGSYPFSHRQPLHQGHCRFSHGHNWTFDVEFSCEKVDQCGFVVDFGALGFVKDYFRLTFDHTHLIAIDDPDAGYFTARPDLFDVRMVPDPSSEGLAKLIFKDVDELVRKMTAGRAFVVKVTVYEDEKNSASWEAGR